MALEPAVESRRFEEGSGENKCVQYWPRASPEHLVCNHSDRIPRVSLVDMQTKRCKCRCSGERNIVVCDARRDEERMIDIKFEVYSEHDGGVDRVDGDGGGGVDVVEGRDRLVRIDEMSEEHGCEVASGERSHGPPDGEVRLSEDVDGRARERV